jgi:hypothetical protein
MKIRSAFLTPGDIHICHRWPDGRRGSYWIPLNRVGEPWSEHLARKTWCTSDLLDEALSEIERARALGGREPRISGVYVIRNPRGVNWKVGVSSNLFRRVDDISAGGPFPVEMVFHVETEAGLELEQRMLRALAPFRTHGEWLELTTEDIQSFMVTVDGVLGDELEVCPGESFWVIERAMAARKQADQPARGDA